MALARVRADGLLEIVEAPGDDLGIHPGDEFQIVRTGGILNIAPAHPAQAARAAAMRLQELAKSGYRSDEDLGPMTAWEEAAVERYENATARFREPDKH